MYSLSKNKSFYMTTNKSPAKPTHLSQDFNLTKSGRSTPLNQTPKKPSHSLPTHQKRYEKYCCNHITRSLFLSFLSELQQITQHINCHLNPSQDLKQILSTILISVNQSVNKILALQSSLNSKHRSLSLAESFQSPEKKFENIEAKLKASQEELSKLKLFLIEKEENKGGLNEELIKKNEFIEFDSRRVFSGRIQVLRDELPCETESSENDSPRANPFLGIRPSEDYEGLDGRESGEAYYRSIKEIEKFDENCLVHQEKENTFREKMCIERCAEIEIGNKWKGAELLGFKEQKLKMREKFVRKAKKDLDRLVLIAKDSIEAYNVELEKREELIVEEKIKNCKLEMGLMQKLKELKDIEASLNSSKDEMEEMSKLMPKFEQYFEVITQIMAQTYSLKCEVNRLIEKSFLIQRNFEKKEEFVDQLIEEYKVSEGNFIGELEVSGGDHGRRKKKNRVLLEIVSLRRELEEKLKILKEKEEEILEIRKKIDEENQDNQKVVLKLSAISMELKNTKLKHEQIIRRKLEKIKSYKTEMKSFLPSNFLQSH